MATNEDIAALRAMINEPTNADPYTNEQLTAVLDAKAGNLPRAAAETWRRKASMYAELVNTSENGSTRQNGDLYKQALAMATMYDGEAEPVANASDLAERPRSRKIVRG